jgi:very-short-patch-repair endonuclease
MRHQRDTPDARTAKVAARQHGVVSVAQLRAAGLDKYQVLRRARAGRLHRIHRGVYAVGHPSLSREGRWMAATLACGKGAVLSHRSAASLWALLPVRTASSVEISVPSSAGKHKRSGICLHRCSSLTPAHVTRHRAILVTTPSRTISDLRNAISQPELRHALRQAAILGLPLGPDGGNDRTRSELEFLFLDLCRKHRLPPPEVNIRIGSLLVDFVWRDRQLIVETDGYRYHRGRVAFEDDRARDLKLRALGYDVIRLTHRQVVTSSEEVLAILEKALGR